ncbi:sensor histidine kinase [Bordetella petrii]|uniref:sensor histidine kinase n=1 Tax=Bordetella petrii TaxID=94624 RepID=UPI001E63E6DA|nr:histidine kinase [Bordetella petrii]MCD0504890.1 histidine kinase [Bordetella petrii]
MSRALNRWDTSPGFWRVQVAGWCCLAAIGFYIRWTVFGNAAAALWLTLALDPVGFALTSMAAWTHARAVPTGRSPGPVVAGVLVSCLAASALLAGIAYGIHGLFPPGALRALPDGPYLFSFIYYMGVLSIWALVYLGVAAEMAARAERFSRLEAQARALHLELEHLQVQIEPHFLFNALNTIVAEIADRPGIAEEMTRRLAGYLRYSLDRREQGLCRLDEEVEATEAYARIQALRFGTRFACHCEIDPATLDMPIPHMTIQGLVENAIKHGMRATGDAHFVINVRTWRHEDELFVRVDNPGVLRLAGDPAAGPGGLGNLCRRLDLRYPHRHEFSLRQMGDMTVATVRLQGKPRSF